MRNPFHALTKNEAAVLRERFIAGTTPPSNQVIADRLKKWLDEVAPPA